MTPPAHRARSTSGAIVGVAGAGKTRLLDAVVTAAEKHGVAVVRLSGSRHAAGGPTLSPHSLLARLGRPPWLLAVDDAQWLDGPALATVIDVARRARAAGGA
jgi:AAA domain